MAFPPAPSISGAQVPTPADPFVSSQDSRLDRLHVEQLVRCLGAHIHTPNRRQLAQELRALQEQLQAQGLGPTQLHGPLFAFPDAVRVPSHSYSTQQQATSSQCLGMC